MSCCVPNCQEKRKIGGLSFHRTPRDAESREKWSNAIGGADFVLHKYSRICANHFHADQFEQRYGKLTLKKGVSPTIFNYSTEKIQVNEEDESALSVDMDAADTCSKVQDANRRKRKCYTGDYSITDMDNQELAKEFYKRVKIEKKRSQKQIRRLKVKEKRMKNKVKDLKGLLKICKARQLLSDSSISTLELAVPEAAKALISGLLRKNSMVKGVYPPELRSFASTLQFYSPKAYDFVRRSFRNCLPHPDTIKKWFRAIDGNPGISGEALDAIKIRVKNSKKPLLCSLILDELAIRKKIEYQNGRMYGYVDYGTCLDSDSIREAKDALVFLVNCLNERWKVPIAYFLINSLTGEEKANFLKNCLALLHETGIIVTNVTFDGLSANLSMVQSLGAETSCEVENMKNWFPHPVTNTRIYIILDPSHMLKLVRNALGSSDIKDRNNNQISFCFIERLVNFQEKGLHAGNKLRKKHLAWRDNKMNVKLAAQTLSNSVAVALNYLNFTYNIPDFSKSEATATFIATINDAFDILNSKSLFAKGYKSALSVNTEKSIRMFLHFLENYFLDLTLNGTPILKSTRKTGFLGLLISLKSLLCIFDDFVKIDKPLLSYILSYKMSQDHLETFFSAIRSRGGNNNNPSAYQFRNSFRRLLLHSQISGSKFANCIPLEDIRILNCPKLRIDEENNQEIDDCSDVPNFENLTEYVQDVISYIAGFVVKKIKSAVQCEACLTSLTSSTWLSALEASKSYTPKQNHNTNIPNENKGLTTASQDVVEICKVAEKVFRAYSISQHASKHNLINILLFRLTRSIDISKIFNSLKEHVLNCGPEDTHILKLTKLIASKYFEIRLHHETNTLNEKNCIRKVRHKFTKLILFKNQ